MAATTTPNLQKLQECHDISHKLISKALDCEECHNVDEAIQYYREGLGLISDGLALPLTAIEWQHGKAIHARMQKNKETFRNRLEELYQQHRQQQQEIEDRRVAEQLDQQNSPSLISRFVNWIWPDDPATINTTTGAPGMSPTPPMQPPVRRAATPARHRRSLSGPDLSIPQSVSGGHHVPNIRSAEAPIPGHSTGSAHRNNALPASRNASSRIGSAPPTRPNAASASASTSASASGNEKAQKISNWRNSPELRGVEPKILDAILNEVMDTSPGVRWDDIAGLSLVKQSLWEAVILPNLRPELFTGLRAPPRGILLFGPPGNGKTMLAKAVSSESKAAFFNISASSLTSKWHGDAEKLVRALFGAARYLQPSVVFIDEIDSVLSSRSSNEHEASRRLKTEFLVQMDGAGSNQNDRILIMGATNRPQELDEAVLRRFVKRIFIPLPDPESRTTLIKSLLSKLQHNMKTRQLDHLAQITEGYSGSDLNALCKEVAMIPLREMGHSVLHASLDSIRPIQLDDFIAAMHTIRPSTSKEQLQHLEQWSREFGSQQ